MEHTLVLILVQHAWRERKPLYGWMDMRHGQSYVVQATEPSFIHYIKKKSIFFSLGLISPTHFTMI